MSYRTQHPGRKGQDKGEIDKSITRSGDSNLSLWAMVEPERFPKVWTALSTHSTWHTTLHPAATVPFPSRRGTFTEVSHAMTRKQIPNFKKDQNPTKYALYPRHHRTRNSFWKPIWKILKYLEINDTFPNKLWVHKEIITEIRNTIFNRKTT